MIRTNIFTSSRPTEEQKEDMKGKSYIDNPDISYDDLSCLKVLHYNYEHEIQVGDRCEYKGRRGLPTDLFRTFSGGI